MKPKQLLILLIACGLVTGIALWKKSGRAGDEPDSPDADNPALFAEFNPEEVGAFAIKTTKHETTVSRDGDKWVVAQRDNFPAAQRLVGEMLNNTGAFHVASYEDFDNDAIAANKLLAPGEGKEEEAGSLVTFTKPGGGGELLSFVAGSTIMAKGSEQGMPPKAQWMKVKGGNKIAKVADGFSDLKAEPKDWLDKEKFFKVEKLKSVAVAGPTPEESWKITREKEGGDLKLDAPAAGEEFDAAKASGQGSAFSYPSFDDILVEAEKAKAALDKPTHTVTLESFEGPTYVVKIGAKVEPPKQDPPKEGETPPTAPDAYYLSYAVTGALNETPPPYATPAPTPPAEPTAPAPLAADANDEAKKKHEADTKAFEEAKKNLDTAKSAHETAVKSWEEGKKAAEEQFKKDLEKKKETLAAQQAQQNRIWIVQKYVLDPVMKKRADFMKDKPAAPAPGTPGATPAPGDAPAPTVTPVPAPAPAPAPAPGGKIEATTPPIEVKIPGADDKEMKEDDKKEAAPAEDKKDETAQPEGNKEEEKPKKKK